MPKACSLDLRDCPTFQQDAIAGRIGRRHDDQGPPRSLLREISHGAKGVLFQISFWLEPMTAARAASYLKTLVRRDPSESGTQALSGRVEIEVLELDFMRALAATSSAARRERWGWGRPRTCPWLRHELRHRSSATSCGREIDPIEARKARLQGPASRRTPAV